MGNTGSKEGGSNPSSASPAPPELDFSSLYVDGEVWNDAQSHSNFLSKVQKCLLDPSFVSALAADQREEQSNADCKERSANFERALSAGAFNPQDLFDTLKPRFNEDLSSTLYVPPYVSTLAKRITLLQHLQQRVSSYRTAAQRPLVSQPRAPPPPSTEEDSQVRMTYTMNRVCLVALNAIVQWGKSSGNIEYIKLPLLELHRMTASFGSQCFFAEAALPLSPPETTVDVEIASAFATSTDANRTPDKALDDQTNSYWCSKKRPGTVYWGVKLQKPTSVSAVTVTWQQNFNSVFVPLEFRIQVSRDGDVYEEMARMEMEELTSMQAAAPLRVAASGDDVLYVRIQMMGYARYNDQGYYGLKSVVIHKVKESPEYLDVRQVLYQLQDWLVSVSAVGELNSTALSAMERVACSSGLLSCVLRFVFSLLRRPENESEIPPCIVEATKHALTCVGEEDQNARGKLAQAVTSPMAPVMSAAFDPYEMSSSGLSLSDDNIHVRCHTASHSHVYVNCGFKEGKWAWEFLVAEDITNDESICIGAGTKPVTSSSYNSSPNLWMYRCYNGNLYRKGGQISGVSKERIHPNDVVRIELDHDTHTLSYRINGDKDQGVCFTDVTGEVYPAVAFYGANRAVRLIAVECAGSTGPGMRYYLSNDPFRRRKWEGETACGLRHGYGKLTYTHTTSYWAGTWKQDKQHGLQAWVVVDAAGKPVIAETVVYFFECDVKKRVATDKDLSHAVKDWDGWICSICAFVSRKANDFCTLCGSTRAVLEKKESDVEESLDSREACCAALLSRLAHLGTIYNSPVGEDPEGREEGVGGTGSTSKELTLPFCAEPRLEVFQLLHDMLAQYQERLDGENEFRIVLSCLRLLRTNFDRLISSHINPMDVGIDVLAMDESGAERSSSLYSLRICLEELMMDTSCHREIGQAAAEALAAGMETLYPDTQIRCNLLCHLLRSHIDSQFTSSPSGQSTLLDRLLRRFGTNEGVVALLPEEHFPDPLSPFASFRPTGTGLGGKNEDTKLLLEYLFKALHMEKSRELDGLVHSRGSRSSMPHFMEQENDDRLSFSDSISVLLGAYLRQLLSFAGRCPDAKEPCSKMLVHFGLMILKYCQMIIYTVVNHISSGSLTTAQAEAFLRGTVVFHLLPLFATASSLLSELLWFAFQLLPKVVQVIQSLDELNRRLPEVVEADKELRLQERALTHNRWVSKKRNEIHAVYDAKEHSEDVSVEDNGKLFRSTSSSNQHALVNVGFRTGKAAWEFKLESDSSNDECSALGAAVKPISSSSYESCPNMWMRRSYNGQLYHGTAAGYTTMSKVHPGDVLRVEVDLDAHTLSFKKNGEDEGVAFTDIEGEIFPAVCTYRSGIEIRLLKVECWQGNSSNVHSQNPLLLLFDASCLPGYVRVDEYDNSFTHSDKERDEKWATAVTSRGISSGRHIWELCVRRCSKAMVAVGVCTNPDGTIAKDQLGLHKNSWAWRADGTLWAHGQQCSSSYGTIKSQHLLSDNDVVTVTLDVHAQCLSFGVNGRDLGLAFGPPGSGAEVEVPVVNMDPYRVFFPGVSLHNYNDKVRIRPAGTMGTLALPWLLDLQNTLVTVGSRLNSTVTAGPKFTDEEIRLEKWMKSPLFALGMERRALLSLKEFEGGIEKAAIRFITGHIDGNDLQDGWGIGDEESYLSSPEKKKSKQNPGWDNDLFLEEEEEEDEELDGSQLGDSSPTDMDRFFEMLVPSSQAPISGDFIENFSLTAQYRTVQKWLDPSGASRITRRLIESYPVVAVCEAYCLAALLKASGVWREALEVLDRKPNPLEGKPSFPPLSIEAKLVSRKLQEIRLTLVKQHQKMKEHQHEFGDRDSLSSIVSLPETFGLVRMDSTDLDISSSMSLSTTVQMDFSNATLELERSDSIPGTPTMDELRVNELSRRVSTGPHTSSFVQYSTRLLDKAQFLLDFRTPMPTTRLKEVDEESSLYEQGLRKIMQKCGEFLTDRDVTCVDELRGLFGLRLVRAFLRGRGLRFYRALLTASSYTSVQVHAIRYLKTALGTQMLRPQVTSKDGTDDNKTTTSEIRDGESAVQGGHEPHHYLKGLEGCPASFTKKVREDFATLYSLLLSLLKKSLIDKNVTLACYILAAWSLDFEPADSRFLLDVKILKSMRSLLSLSRLSRCISAGIVITDNNGLHWVPWPVEDVRNGLGQGRITKRIVIEHMRSAPTNILPRSWWGSVGLSPDAGDLDVLVGRLRIGDVIVLYETMLRYVTEKRRKEKAELALADKQAREENRRKRGIRYTYIVTATNGVGVRQLPDTRAERTGHSFKQHEIVEASYRIAVGNRQMYIKLVDSGWVFDVGVRGSYKDKPIMKCIATEPYVAEEDSVRKLRSQAGRLVILPKSYKVSSEPVEVSSDGLTAYYREMGTDNLAIIQGSVRFPLPTSEIPEPRSAWVDSKLGRSSRSNSGSSSTMVYPLKGKGSPSCYYEVTVHCGGTRHEIRVGLSGSEESYMDQAPGVERRTVALHVKDWSIWSAGEKLFCGREKEGDRLSGDLKHPLVDLDDDDQSLLSRLSDEGTSTASLGRPLDLRDLRNFRKIFATPTAASSTAPFEEGTDVSPENLLGVSIRNLSEAKAIMRGQQGEYEGDESKTASVKDTKADDDLWYEVETLATANDSDDKIAAANKMLLEALVSSETGSKTTTGGFEAKASSRHSRMGSSSDDMGPASPMLTSASDESVHDKLLFAPLQDGDIVGCGIDHGTKKIFFTRNGRKLPQTVDVESLGGKDATVHPVMSLSSHCEVVEVNMGPSFEYKGSEVPVVPRVNPDAPPLLTQEKFRRDSSSLNRQGFMPQSRGTPVSARMSFAEGIRLQSPIPLPLAPYEFESPSTGGFGPPSTPHGMSWAGPHNVDVLQTTEDESLIKEDGHDYACGLTVPEMDALHATTWPLFQLLVVQGVQFSTCRSRTDTEEQPVEDQVPPKLRRLMSRSGPIEDVLALQMSGSPLVTATTQLRQDCFSLIIEQLRACAEVLIGRKGEDGAVGGAEPVKVEAITFRYLLLLFPLVEHLPQTSTNETSFSLPHRFLSCLFALLVCGSPRIQRLVCRNLRRTLELTSPSHIDGALTRFLKSKECIPFVDWILDRMSLALGRSSGMPLSALDEDSFHRYEAKLGVFACTSGSGAGHANLGLVCEEACLLRLLLAYPRWQNIMVKALLASFEAANSYLSDPSTSSSVPNKILLRCLASLFVISDSDMLRVGGVVDRVFPGATERYTVVEYSRGSSKILAVDMSKAGNNTVSLPVSAVFTGGIVPVPEVETPKFPDSVAKALLSQLYSLAQACPRSKSGLPGPALVVWARNRTLTLSAFRTLLRHFRNAWAEPLIPQISSVLFSYALQPVPLPFCPLSAKIEGKMQMVSERIYEAVSLGSNYLSSVPPDQRASSLRLDEEERRNYRVILKEGAVVRDGLSIDNSSRVAVLKVGTVVEVVETCVSPEGVLRFRIKEGWVSERCHGGSEDLILERVSKAMSDDILVERKDMIDPNKVPEKGVKHRLHDSLLRLLVPRDLFPDAAGWECDHCSVSFSPQEPAFVANLPSRNWLLCHNCFCSDPRAVAVAKGSVKAPPLEEAAPKVDEDLLRPEAPAKVTIDEFSMDELALRMDSEVKETAPRLSVMAESQVTRVAVMRLAEMGFPEDQVRPAVAAALPATGSATMDSLEQVIEQTIEYLTSGMPPMVVEEDDEVVEDHEEDVEAEGEMRERDDDDDDDDEEDLPPPRLAPMLSHDKSYSIAEMKDGNGMGAMFADAFGLPDGGEVGDSRTDDHRSSRHEGRYWRDTDGDKLAKINKLSRSTHFPRSICRCALEMNGGDLDDACHWIANQGIKYLPDGGRNICMYPVVFFKLGLLANLTAFKTERQLDVQTKDEEEEEDDQPELDGVEEGAIMQKLSARIGNGDSEECLLYEASGPCKPIGDGAGYNVANDDELVFEEAIVESLEVERMSKVHKMIVALVCTRCQYLEFPGCSQHSQLLSVRKPNGHGKCARCSCATDLHSPWDKGCRICRKPTKKCFWAMTVRETQFLLRAFPPACRLTNDDTCEMYVLHCPECEVVGFPGIGGTHPSLCTRSQAGPFTVVATGESLPSTTWHKSLRHVGACPMAGKPLDELLVRVSFSEAKYLYKTAANVETFANYVVRAKGLRDGTLLAVCDEEGPMNMLVARLGTARVTGGTSPLAEVAPSYPALKEHVIMDIYDEERGFAMPHTVGTAQTRVVTHMYGIELGVDGLQRMRKLAMKTDAMLAARYAREAIVWMMSHWSPQHPPTLSSLGIRNWQPFIQTFKLVGLVDRSFKSSTAEMDLGTFSSSALAEAQPSAAAGSSGRSTSLAAVFKKQVILWLRTMGTFSRSNAASLFESLLDDSLYNLYAIALGESLNTSSESVGKNPQPPPLCPPPLLRRASSYDLGSSLVAVRQSLHPFYTPAHYGEVVRVAGAQSLRVNLDARSSFGTKAEAYLSFWRSEEDARAGKAPLKRLPDKAWTSGSGISTTHFSFVVPNTDSLYYTFQTRGDRGRRQRLPSRLEIEPTNFCRDDYTVDGGVLRCTGGFPSIAPKDVVLNAGKWYYEVTLMKAGLAQLGWCDMLFTGNSLKGEGVGDDIHSWGLDGHRVFKWHGGGVRWGRAWTEGDVIGFMADLDKRCFSFSMNGSLETPMGLAFENITFVEGVRPCLTMNKTSSLRINFGEEPFRYAPAGFRPIIEAPRDHVLKKQYWGYRFEVSSCMGLQTRPISDFKSVWKSKAVSGPGGDVTTIWRPKVRPGCALLGDVATSGGRKPDATLVVVDDDSPLLAYPVGYTRIMTLDSPSETIGSIWRPKPPEGYVSMGDVFSLGYGEPSTSLVRCLRRDVVEPAPLYRRIRVWQEARVSNGVDTDSGRNKNVTMWAVGNQSKSFLITEGFSTPFSQGFSEAGWAIKGALPGTMHQTWQSEGEACDQPSMEWALWVLDCFLENCSADMLYENGGILSGQTYEALVKCIVDSHCTDRTRTPAASLLTRLLRTRRTHTNNTLADLPFSVRALGKITHDLLKFCREKLQSGRLFLQRDLQQIVELVATINWASPQTMAVQRAYSGSGFDLGLGGPSDSLGNIQTGKGRETVLSQLKKVAKGERPSDEDSLVDLMEMTDFFARGYGGSGNSSGGDEASSNTPFCGTWLRAWVDTMACSSTVQSQHPLVPTARLEGSIAIDGADAIELVFDARCCLPKGTSLILQGFGPLSTVGDWSDEANLIEWKCMGRDGDESWATRPVFRGSTVRWRVQCEEMLTEEDQEAPPAETSSTWGYSFTGLGQKISPGFRLRQLLENLQDSEPTLGFDRWTQDNDIALVDWINQQAELQGKESVEIAAFDFRHGHGDTSSICLQLESLPVQAVYMRIALIQGLNRSIRQALPLIELGSSCRHSLGYRLRGLCHLVFKDIKMGLIEAAKDKTQGSGGSSLTITLDNFSASRSMEANEKDIKTSRCIFVQAFRALHHKDSKVLRSCWDGDRVFQVTFRGENGSDAGGVFREGMSRIVEDLFSDTLNLLIPCPNALHGLPNNMDKFIPSPRLACCPLALEMYEFVGKLMGMSMRANLCLPFQFPSLVWKRLLGQELTVKDMEAVDTLTCKLLDSVRGCHDATDFNDKYGDSLTFVCTDWDGSEMELFPGGSSEAVVFETRLQFCDLLQEHRLHEFDAQVSSMARGLFAIVPRNTLLLFTWREFEVLVCGSPIFDMEFWRRHTTYSGYSEDDPTIKLFWKVLESLTQEEQSGFVRFAWGRSRLPPKTAWFKDMQISRRNTGEDSLPASHTCFFSIELPPYKSEATMRKGLLTAIHFGMVGILNT